MKNLAANGDGDGITVERSPLGKEVGSKTQIPVFLPRKSHEQRSWVGYGPQGHENLTQLGDQTELDRMKRRP